MDKLSSVSKDSFEIAEYVQSRLKDRGYIIHRYDAVNTQSIYLKIDYGLGGCIRISDHQCKKYLNYKFNLLINSKSKNMTIAEKHFYNKKSVNKMIRDVIKFRENKVIKCGDVNKYMLAVERAKIDSLDKRGFWRSSHEVEYTKDVEK